MSGYHIVVSKSMRSNGRQRTPNAYAKTKMDSIMFSRIEPASIPRSLEIAGREGEDIDEATGLGYY